MGHVREGVVTAVCISEEKDASEARYRQGAYPEGYALKMMLMGVPGTGK